MKSDELHLDILRPKFHLRSFFQLLPASPAVGRPQNQVIYHDLHSTKLGILWPLPSQPSRSGRSGRSHGTSHAQQWPLAGATAGESRKTMRNHEKS